MSDVVVPREVIIYVDGNDKEPFTKWLNGLRDAKGRRCILRRMQKLKQGIYGDHKLLGQGLSELRIFFGPGYRIYLGEHKNKIVVLLGGDKDSQQDDIQRARDYWKEYKSREKLL